MDQKTTLGLSSNDKKVLVGGGFGIGLALGLLSGPIWSFAKQFEWLPFHGPIDALMSVDGSWTFIMRTVILTAAGVILALILVHTSPQLTVSREGIEVKKAGDTRVIKRSQVAGIYYEKSKLIIESPDGRRLYAGDAEGGKQKIAEAFKAYGYPWESK